MDPRRRETLISSEMSQKLVGHCQHCGGMLQFDADDAGRRVPCPLCQQHTLVPGKRSRAKPAPMGLFVGMVVVLLILGVAAGFFVRLLRPHKPVSNAATQPAAPTPSQTVETPSAKPAEPELPIISSFKVSPVTLQKPSTGRLVYAIGTLHNIFDRQRFGVRVELNVLNAAGNKIGTATDYANVIEPKGSWSFKALVTDSTASSAEISAIKENF